MDIDLFKEFAFVVKHGNLSEAAKELHITESVLSRHLKTLETDTGLTLFDRSTNPMSLTPVGEQFLEHASRIGNEQLRLQTFIARQHSRTYNVLKVSGVIDAAVLPLVRAANRTARGNGPETRVKFVSPQYQTPFNLIRSGELDIAIEPLSTLIDTHDLEWVHLASEQPLVILGANDPLAEREAFEIDDLPELPVVTPRTNRSNALRKHVQQLCRNLGEDGDIPKFFVLSPEDTYDELLLAGLRGYVVVLPEHMARHCVDNFEGEYVLRPLVGEGVDYDICAFYRPDAQVFVLDYVRALERAADLTRPQNL